MMRSIALSVAIFALSLEAVPQTPNPALGSRQSFRRESFPRRVCTKSRRANWLNKRPLLPMWSILAVMEVHDHTLVNNGLKTVAALENIAIASTLSTDSFSSACKRCKTNPDRSLRRLTFPTWSRFTLWMRSFSLRKPSTAPTTSRPFARLTDLIVKRHIGALHALDAS